MTVWPLNIAFYWSFLHNRSALVTVKAGFRSTNIQRRRSAILISRCNRHCKVRVALSFGYYVVINTLFFCQFWLRLFINRNHQINLRLRHFTVIDFGSSSYLLSFKVLYCLEWSRLSGSTHIRAIFLILKVCLSLLYNSLK